MMDSSAATQLHSPWPECNRKYLQKIFRNIHPVNLIELLHIILSGHRSSTIIIRHVERKLDNDHDLFGAHDYAVHQWTKIRKPPPSWDALVEALRECNEQYLAEKIECHDLTLFEESPSGSFSSSEDSETDTEVVIRELEVKFCKIREDFRKYLRSNREKCIEFCDFLRSPADSYAGLEEYFTKNEIEEMEIDSIFKKLQRNALNCFDYGVLSYLITYCGEPDLIERMKQYEKRVKSKCSRITVHQLADNWSPPVFDETDIPESFRTCAVKMLQDPNKYTAQDLRKLGHRFEGLVTEPTRMGVAYFRLFHVVEGSVTAMWIVFTNKWPELMDKVRELVDTNSDFVQEIQLAVFILDDHIFYPCTDQEELWNATREGASGVVRKLLEDARVDPNTEYETFKRTALQCAAKYGHVSSAKLLLLHNADINYQDSRGYTALMIALRAGQAAMAEYLLDYGADINIPEHAFGMAPLIFAIQNNNLRMFELLKRYHADLNARAKDGRTPLIIAAENGNEEIVRSLVSEGEEVIDMEAQDIDGRTAIHVATIHGWTKIIKILLKHPNALFLKDMNNDTPKDIAVKNKNAELEDIFRPYFLEDEIIEGASTLVLASSDAELAQVTSYDVTLPEEEQPQASIAGATPQEDVPGTSDLPQFSIEKEEKQDSRFGSRLKKFGQSVVQSVIHVGNLNVRLIRAASSGDAVLADKLLRKGADPNTRRWEVQMWTPLMIAANKGYTLVVKVLLKYGADPNIVTITAGYTVLLIASKEGNHDIVDCLLDPSNPVPLDIKAVNAAPGWGALMWAAQSRFSSEAKSEQGIENRCKLIQSLVKAGVNINKPVENGWTPLMQASQDNNLKLVQMMCKIDGIDLDHESKSSWTAITTACRKGNEDVVIELTEAGADINKKKKGGYTALHMACYKGLLKAVKCMVPLLKDGTRQGRKITPDVNVKDNWGMTPLILATKQGHHDVAKYLISTDQPQINIRAERYAQWTAVFFAIRNGDENILDLLVENLADMTITDENNITPANYAKSLFINKQMHKLLEHKKEQQKQKQQQQEEQPKVKDEDPVGRSSSIVDVVKYNQVELIWRTRQQIYLTLNI